MELKKIIFMSLLKTLMFACPPYNPLKIVNFIKILIIHIHFKIVHFFPDKYFLIR